MPYPDGLQFLDGETTITPPGELPIAGYVPLLELMEDQVWLSWNYMLKEYK